MRSIVVDSGPLIALFDASDRWHSAAVEFVQHDLGRLVTNVAVLTEVVCMLDFSLAAQRDFLRWIRRAATIEQHTPDDLPRIEALLETYRDLPADFADASLVVLCERLGTFDVASVDSDFNIYRIHDKKRFRNRFLDAVQT